MMGAPISFWDLSGAGDDFVSALVLALALLPSALRVRPVQFSHVIVLMPRNRYEFLSDISLFHPPVAPH